MTYTTDQLRDIADTLRREGRSAEFLSLLIEGATAAPVYREGPMGNVYVRPMPFEKVGDHVELHRHNYDHVTFVVRGSLLCTYKTPDGDKTGERVYRAPSMVLIKKDVLHGFTALEPESFAACVFVLRDAETGAPVDSWDGSMRPYL